MTVGSVSSSGLANVQARIAAIQAQVAALATPRVATLLTAPAATSASTSTGTSGPSFAAALDSAVGRQSLGASPGVSGATPLLSGSTTPAVPGSTMSPLLPGLSATQPLVPAATTPGATGAWTLPAQGRISSDYGHRSGVAGRAHEFHTGLDIAAPKGTPVRAATSGVVKSAGPNGNYGNAVVIDHGNGVTTRYAHNSVLHVVPGQQIQAGATIAAVGSTGRSTGAHLHFEVLVNGDHVDPAKWLMGRGVAL